MAGDRGYLTNDLAMDIGGRRNWPCRLGMLEGQDELTDLDLDVLPLGQ